MAANPLSFIMKPILLLCLLTFSTIVPAADIDLKGKLPEDFDWAAYFSQDDSTAGEMNRSRAAASVLGQRMDELCDEYRALLTERGDTESVKLLDEMQKHWKKSASAEVKLVGSAWEGGSGAKAAYPKHLFKVFLRRVKELKELKADCLCLNE